MLIAQVAAPTVTGWGEFGLMGAVIGGLFASIYYFVSQHRAERSEWRTDIKDISVRHREELKVLTEQQNATAKEITDKFVALHESAIKQVTKER